MHKIRGNVKIIAILVILAATFLYSIVRYNIIKGTPWEHFPLFISNKALSLSAVVSIGLSYALGSLARFIPSVFTKTLSLRKFFGLLGFSLAAIHTLMSLLIFSPATYQKFYTSSGQLNLTGELSMLFGVLGFFIFLLVAIASIPSIAQSLGKDDWLLVQKLGYLGLILVLLHVLTMGLEGWLKPETWPGKLLPISLIAAIIIAFSLLVKLLAIIFPKTEKPSS